jgi:hypothetical protein
VFGAWGVGFAKAAVIDGGDDRCVRPHCLLLVMNLEVPVQVLGFMIQDSAF